MKYIVSLPPLVLLALLSLAPVSRSADEPAGAAPPAIKNVPVDLRNAELLAIQENGRKKPLQTFAIETMEQICGRPLFGSTFYTDPATEMKFGAMDLFLSFWFQTKFWEDKPVILATNAELRKTIALPAMLRGADAGAYAGTGRTLLFDIKHLSVQDLVRSDVLAKIVSDSRTKKEAELSSIEREAQLVWTRLQLMGQLKFGDNEFAVVPHWKSAAESWFPVGIMKEALDDPKTRGGMAYDPKKLEAVTTNFEEFKRAYRNREGVDQAAFNLRVAMRELSPSVYPADDSLQLEVNYNTMRPFAWAWLFYLLALIVTAFALYTKPKIVYVTALALFVAGLGMHVYGFALRCIIAGRPPVSNMYESVIWVGFGCVAFGLIFELIYRRKLFMLAASFAGFLCLVLMDLLPVLMHNSKQPGLEHDINPLQPVLRDNFWLTVHVLTITLSYAAFMLAWGMGHITLCSHLFRPNQKHEHRELHHLVYRVLQVGVLLLACGTILGGVWANYSWGRFWGWDPKETWAAIALLCYIVVLHGRFAGLWTNFGLAFGSVFCFQSVVMAWYGVNFVLGSGKHAYGAGQNAGMPIVLTIIGLDMAFLGAATYQYWCSKKTKAALAPDVDDRETFEAAEEAADPLPVPTASKEPKVRFG